MKRITVAITGATGAIYGVRLLESLAVIPHLETHLIVSNSGAQTLAYETSWNLKTIKDIATHVYSNKNLAAPIASGSFPIHSMFIAPCSVNTLSRLATGVSDTLIVRAADVMLKEHKRVVLMFRETPLHIGHIKSMLQVSEMGAVVAPISPAFYSHPQSLDDIVNHSVGRALDLARIEHDLVSRWGGYQQL